MSKFKIATSISVAAIGVLVASSAAAGSFGPFGVVNSLLNYSHTGSKNYRIQGLQPGSGHGCPSTDYMTVIPSASDQERELMSQTLLAAFLAGKQVRVETATSLGAGNCVDGRPVYSTVQVR